MTAERPRAGDRVASYDIGSNSVILLVAERADDGSWLTVADHVEVARISEGLDASGRLADGAVARAEEVLRRFAARAAALGVSRTFATGTAPFRRAANGPEVARRLSAVIGAPVTVVSGEHEAELSLLATRRSFPELRDLVVIDIGGASTELVRVRPGADVAMTSLDVGSVRLTERCVRSAPLSAADRESLAAAVAAALDDPAVEAILAGAPALVGIAGTVTTIVTVARQIDTWDAAQVHGYDLALAEIEGVFDRLASRTVAEREALPGMPRGRADVLPAGALLLASVVRRAGADRVRVSDRGTRWGRLYEELG